MLILLEKSTNACRDFRPPVSPCHPNGTTLLPPCQDAAIDIKMWMINDYWLMMNWEFRSQKTGVIYDFRLAIDEWKIENGI